MRGGRDLIGRSGASVRPRARRERHISVLRRRRPGKPPNNRYDVTDGGLERGGDGAGGSAWRRPPLPPLLLRVLEEKLPSREQVVRLQQLVRLLM